MLSTKVKFLSVASFLTKYLCVLLLSCHLKINTLSFKMPVAVSSRFNILFYLRAYGVTFVCLCVCVCMLIGLCVQMRMYVNNGFKAP